MNRNLFDIDARFSDKTTMVADVRRFITARTRLEGREPTLDELEPTEATVADARLWLSAIALFATGIASEYDTTAKRDVELLLDGGLRPYLRVTYEMAALAVLVSIGAPIGNGNFNDVSPAIRLQTATNLFAAAHALLEADVRDGYAIPPSRWYAAT